MSKRKGSSDAGATGSLFPERTGRVVTLGEGEREEFDAYYTPLACAIALCKLTRELVELHHARNELQDWTGWPRSGIETSVGAGAWVLAMRRAWREQSFPITRIDIDPHAPGLLVDRRMGDMRIVGSYLQQDTSAWTTTEFDLNLGNYPYSEDLPTWMDRSLAHSPVCGQLLRSTALGSKGRREWWSKKQPPAYVVTVSPRCLWEGPGARNETDSVDPVFALWLRGITDTRHRWLGWNPS